MLPKLPFPLILHFLYVIMGNPIRVVVKHGCTKVLFLKLIIGIDDGFNMILVFNNVQPSQHVTLKIFH